AAPKASMASTAVRSATVPAGAAATASTGPASVTRGSTAASATWSASQGSLGQGAGRRAPAPWAWPATLSAASVGSSVPLATTGRTAAK
ncbi:hypothetical protein JEQ12_003779, partial [Ovis aries]